ITINSVVGEMSGTSFVGIDNYTNVLRDDYFWTSLRNNLWFLLQIPVQTFLALILALLLNHLIATGKTLRIIYFLPHITNMVAVLMVWNMLFNPSKGPVNAILRAIGIDNPPMWHLDTLWAKPTLALFGVWGALGYYALIYAASLTGIPKDLYEAADIDGANARQKFWRITFPLISPTTLFIVMVSTIGSFQQWSSIQVFTDGGPGSSTYVLGYFVYKYGFSYFRMGYASAAAWLLAVIIIGFTILQWKLQKKWVHYG
ncbi:MAG: sugar ABC transporter permease, partial [Paenibacillaceae bacterium]|nr:sugar ABC transporter permease [Paenibacillaceae bacterium]